MQVTLYHNPNCSKSREALTWLEQTNADIHIIHYLKNPPTAQDYLHLAQMLGGDLRDMIRTKEAEYQQLHLSDANDEALLAALVQYPKLLERPIAICQGKAAIGRPLDNIIQLYQTCLRAQE